MTPNISGAFFVTFATAFALITLIGAWTGWYAAKHLKKAEGTKAEDTK